MWPAGRHDPPGAGEGGLDSGGGGVVAVGLGLLQLTGQAARDCQGCGRVITRMGHFPSFLSR
jgi:hypothetical protein